MGKVLKHNILIFYKEIYRKLGNVIISRSNGDILYVPSQRKTIASNYGTANEVIDHIAWHKTGRVHIKMVSGKKYVFEYGRGEVAEISDKRQPILDIGYQEILRDTVIDMQKLPILKKKINELDIVFRAGNYSGAIQFHFSIVSEHQIIKVASGQETPIKNVYSNNNSLLIDVDKRFLGYESGNADKLLQYSLYKFIGTDLKKGRRVFVSKDSKITRD
jgi:hypothetical protein